MCSTADDDLNYLVLKVELDELPEDDEDGDDDGYDFPYWYVGVPVFGLGFLAFACAYKCAESSQVRFFLFYCKMSNLMCFFGGV